MPSILADLPAMNMAQNPARKQDELEVALSHIGPFLACHMIEHLYRKGRFSRDDAQALLSMHAERCRAEIVKIDQRIVGE